jgi:hypothetical protein
MQSDPKIQRIAADARLFHDLSEEPGWHRLRRRVTTEHEAYVLHLGKRLFSGVDVDANLQREVDFHRGWYMGLEWFTGVPERALDNFEDAAKKAYTLAILDLETVSQENSPYE